MLILFASLCATSCQYPSPREPLYLGIPKLQMRARIRLICKQASCIKVLCSLPKHSKITKNLVAKDQVPSSRLCVKILRHCADMQILVSYPLRDNKQQNPIKIAIPFYELYNIYRYAPRWRANSTHHAEIHKTQQIASHSLPSQLT